MEFYLNADVSALKLSSLWNSQLWGKQMGLLFLKHSYMTCATKLCHKWLLGQRCLVAHCSPTTVGTIMAAEHWWLALSGPQLMAGKRCSHNPLLDRTSITTQSNQSAFGIKSVPRPRAKFKTGVFCAGCFFPSLWRGYSQHISSGRKPAACNSKMGIFLPGAQIRCLFCFL